MKHTVLFYDASFPYEGVRPNGQQLSALAGIGEVADAEQLASALAKADCLVYLHGKYVPKKAWPALLAFLKRGGGLVHIGGEPLRVPVYLDNGRWRTEPVQTAYHQALNIHEMLAVDAARIVLYEANADIPLFAGKERLFEVQPTVGFVLHATKADDLPGQGGTSGPMDVHIHPLLKGVTADGREMSAPVVLMENTKGDFAGGRWMFVNQTMEAGFWSQGGAASIREWRDYCARGVTEIWFMPNYACYEPGERPVFKLQLQDLGRRADCQPRPSVVWQFSISIAKVVGTKRSQLWIGKAALQATGRLSTVRLPIPVTVAPGYYVAECAALSSEGERRIYRQGFWGWDAALLGEGEPLACDRDYFRKDGKPFPIIGMTYMASDVARKFLFLPNAAVWDKDMAQMKKAGINYIRTGIWTAWRHVMFVDGHPSEEAMRAIDAFMLTAKKHGLELTFTFFAFTPESWEGVNPYLDPRSVEAQKRFVAAIAERHAGSMHVHWDLINEPSMFRPDRTFSGPQTSGDVFERELFARWLEERHDGDIRLLQERWNMTPLELPSFSAAAPPSKEEINFYPTAIVPSRNNPWLDYCLFTMEMHNRWARELGGVIRAIAPLQLVTAGQDEALAGQRPSPFFYESVVDYTNVHSWWQMDDLIWDGVFAKSPGKPCLVQETGMMYVETADGKAKRSETELRNMLERKYAYAFATGSAGAVQWVWNINVYMNNVNESNIGAVRADGTEKPEADISYEFGRFMGEIGCLFEGRRLEDIVVVYPYSNDFSARSLALAATTKLTRTMAYELKQPFRAMGEYQLESLSDQPPKLIIVPSPHNFSGDALSRILKHVKEQGGTLLFTGPMSLDEYWRQSDRMIGLLGATKLGNVLREEALELEGRLIPVSFGGNRLAEAFKETGTMDEGASGSMSLTTRKIGKGTLLWCPLPIELNERTGSLAQVYDYAIGHAGVEAELLWLKGGELPGLYGRKLAFRDGALYIFVSEYAAEAEVEITDPETCRSYSFLMEAERTVMFAADASGELLAVYRPEEVEITVSG
ncbi:alpha-amylase family protein [Paenibacillus harenae]|uniref:alpha-amylase family protein n=1 Tax=Paenibacillus harenae TaxID=306543 RepID=UPI0027908957|nr:alpha-amylase family protein [Paenibacillus harenae]MDQ0063447.1 hypothetical protein [Paenibacillus harenae]